jgi:hypothetical protein
VKHEPIVPISEAEFWERMNGNPTPSPPDGLTEFAWYASATGHMLGVVNFDLHYREWGWSLLGRDAADEFQLVDAHVEQASREAA